MLNVLLELVDNHWALLAGCGAFLAACLVGIRDFLTIRKLRMELAQMKSVESRRDSLITVATLEQIEKYARPEMKAILFFDWWVAAVSLMALLGVLYLGLSRTIAIVGLSLFVYFAVRWAFRLVLLANVAKVKYRLGDR